MSSFWNTFSPIFKDKDLKTLEQLGFSEVAAKAALKYKNCNLEAAMDYLLNLTDEDRAMLEKGEDPRTIVKKRSIVQQPSNPILEHTNSVEETITADELPERFGLFKRMHQSVYVVIKEIQGDQIVVEFSDSVTQTMPLKNLKLDVIPPDEILSHYGYPTRKEIIALRVPKTLPKQNSANMPAPVPDALKLEKTLSNTNKSEMLEEVKDQLHEPFKPPRVTSFELDEYLDVKDNVGHWIKSQIIEVEKHSTEHKIRIHYLQWDSRYDETIDLKVPSNLLRLAPFNSMSSTEENKKFLLLDAVKVYALKPSPGFYLGSVRKVDGAQVMVQYSAGTQEFNIWHHIFDTFSLRKIDIVEHNDTNYTHRRSSTKVDEFSTEIAIDNTDLSPWAVGQLVEVKNDHGDWVTAIIINKNLKLSEEKVVHHSVKIHLIDRSNYWDKWIDITAEESKVMRILGSAIGLSDLELNLLKEDETFRSELKSAGLNVVNMEKDGNCMFRAFAHQIYGDPELHAQVRKSCYDYMIQERNFFDLLFDNDLDTYVDKQRKLNVWGDEIELRSMAELFNKRVDVYEHGRPIRKFCDSEECESLSKVLLSFHGSNHYNSLLQSSSDSFVPLGDGSKDTIRLREIRIRDNSRPNVPEPLRLTEKDLENIWHSFGADDRGMECKSLNPFIESVLQDLVRRLDNYDSKLQNEYDIKQLRASKEHKTEVKIELPNYLLRGISREKLFQCDDLIQSLMNLLHKHHANSQIFPYSFFQKYFQEVVNHVIVRIQRDKV